MSLLIAGGLHWVTFKGPFKPLYDSIIQKQSKIPIQLLNFQHIEDGLCIER